MPDWEKIKAEYIRGRVSYQKLALRHSVSLSTLTKRAMKGKWADLRKETRKKADAKISESVANREARREGVFQTLADKLLQHITDNIDVLASSATSCKDITVAIKNLRDIKGVKSDLDMQEQIERINKLKRDAQNDDSSANRDVTVTFDGDISKYSK